MRRADEALYAAKHGGRDCTTAYLESAPEPATRSQNASVLEHRPISGLMRGADDKNRPLARPGRHGAAAPAAADPRDALRWGTRQDDRWLERWIRSTEDLARLQYSHRMLDAVIDEIDGRQIRVGDQWLTDYASCNYLGLDLDEEIIDAIPAYLRRVGHAPELVAPAGQPDPLRADRGPAHRAPGLRGQPRAADDHPHPHVGDPGPGRRRHGVPRQPSPQDDLRRMRAGRRAAAPPSSGSRTRTSTTSRRCCAIRAGAAPG